MKSDLESIEYLAATLRVNLDTARRMCRQHEVGGVFKVGKNWFVHKPSFEQWIVERAAAQAEKGKRLSDLTSGAKASVFSVTTRETDESFAALMAPVRKVRK